MASDVEPPPPPPAQPLLHRCHAVYTRDYSVDEKSDALFREFSRCEPPQPELLARGQRLGGSGAYRRHSHGHAHHGRHGHYAGAYPYARADAAAAVAVRKAVAAVPGVAAAVTVAVVAASEKGLVPAAGAVVSTASPRFADDAAAAAVTPLPVIRVADEDSSDRP